MPIAAQKGTERIPDMDAGKFALRETTPRTLLQKRDAIIPSPLATQDCW
jgi:hypothetical protein